MVETKIDPFDKLSNDVKSLAIQIDTAYKEEDTNLANTLKKQMYEKKIEQLSILQSDIDINSTVTAQELKIDVDNRPSVPKYSTGIEALDLRLKGGIDVGTFIQLAGESFAGKTHFVLEILTNISGNAPVLFFNFEMGETRISKKLDYLLQTTEQTQHFMINSKARKLSDILKEIKSKAKQGVKFFAIDSKMKIEVPEELEDLKAFRKISHELSKMAQQEEIIIFLINQMNEEDQKNSRLAFKGGGDQMYDTDIALFYMVNKTQGQEPKDWTRTMHCRKNRQDDEQLFKIDLYLDEYGKTKESA